ncbi:tripartite tricarboxylate transporter family receptor [Variibacter gotjawalensis]|uniref:Tripartite tricarboxylate transporter family receptor n=1 Tax=Variibacter gotjawalensis TaxID=1333996 RepID=A0A0S3PW47_9BRAD|nr:tripartite tricarboxylate transporter substrate binding protein [Variibacter gotjawalensis]NIK46001.1 tripartite-type tricarboxylate transporter receptor subunit TctC [Variibacter gotjawalensis]RZS47919.1 tripartite-type tricarboxylate transporter receptor subunit TctC [Variibacter gotjawalensis]BAT60175.1 tripartite tricarboxylate transporter family receptor [Variibacter gotjawalensis]
MSSRLSRRTVVAALSLSPFIATKSFAQSYPTKPIRFVVPYLAGGTTDLVARVVGEKVGAKLGQPVVVENRPGAGGNIGMDAVAKAEPDGHTIGFGAISTNALNPHIYKAVPFDPRKDFTAVSLLGTSTIVLEVGPSVPVKNVAEFIAHAKANPGLQYGTAGNGTSMHLAGVLFAQMTGTQMTHVAYRGSAPGINDMLGGHLGAMFDNLPASLPHIKAGKLTALAVASSARSPALPDVPTVAEAGLPGYAVEPWFGVYGPAKMPPAVTAALNAAFVEALGLAEVKDKLSQAGFNPKSSSAAELEALTQSEYEKFGKVARDAKITVE